MSVWVDDWLRGAKSEKDKWTRWRQAVSDLKAPVCQIEM